MKYVRYTRYTGDDFGLSAEDLMQALSDFFLQSGFQNPYMQFSEWDQHSLEDLKRAIEKKPSVSPAALCALAPDAPFERLFIDLEASPYHDLVVPKSGRVAVPDGPGLGCDPDMDVLRRYLVEEPGVHRA